MKSSLMCFNGPQLSVLKLQLLFLGGFYLINEQYNIYVSLIPDTIYTHTKIKITINAKFSFSFIFGGNTKENPQEK